jgi:uncharacterized protein with NRDE domain
MCLIVFAWKQSADTPLLLAANRDEFYARPALAASWWEEAPNVYAGKDLEAGGTWMGINKQGRFAAITNIRNGEGKKSGAPSRGNIVADFLRDDISASSYLHALEAEAKHYAGFNLIIGDANDIYWFSNAQQQAAQRLQPGIYGLSNASLDTPWPKVIQAKTQFQQLLEQRASDQAYFDLLADTTQAPEHLLPQTGVSLEWERLLSSIHIHSNDYGTRVSSLIKGHADGSMQLTERALR